MKNDGIVRKTARRVKSRIVWDWRERVYDYSTRALAAITALAAAYAGAPDSWLARVPPIILDNVITAIFVLGVLGTIGKFLTQPPPK